MTDSFNSFISFYFVNHLGLVGEDSKAVQENNILSTSASTAWLTLLTVLLFAFIAVMGAKWTRDARRRRRSKGEVETGSTCSTSDTTSRCSSTNSNGHSNGAFTKLNEFSDITVGTIEENVSARL